RGRPRARVRVHQLRPGRQARARALGLHVRARRIGHEGHGVVAGAPGVSRHGHRGQPGRRREAAHRRHAADGARRHAGHARQPQARRRVLSAAARALRATQVLHCNLNVTELTSASALYERALGLEVRMRSESVDGDSTPLGIDGPTHSIAWFLYDHRGGHVSPAVELVEWIEPRTTGAAYADPTAVGMQSLIFATPSPAECRAALLDAGATDASPAELFDRDGVRIELTGDSSAHAATFVGLRLSCVDLETSVEWYGHL